MEREKTSGSFCRKIYLPIDQSRVSQLCSFSGPPLINSHLRLRFLELAVAMSRYHFRAGIVVGVTRLWSDSRETPVFSAPKCMHLPRFVIDRS